MNVPRHRCLSWGEYRAPWIWLFSGGCSISGRPVHDSTSPCPLTLLCFLIFLLPYLTITRLDQSCLPDHVSHSCCLYYHLRQALGPALPTSPPPQPETWMGALSVLSHPFWWVQRTIGLSLVGAVPELLPRGWWPPRELTSSLGWLQSSCTPGHTNYLVTLPGLRLIGDLGCSGISQVLVAPAVRAVLDQKRPLVAGICHCHSTDQSWSSFSWRITVRFLYATFLTKLNV